MTCSAPSAGSNATGKHQVKLCTFCGCASAGACGSSCVFCASAPVRYSTLAKLEVTPRAPVSVGANAHVLIGRDGLAGQLSADPLRFLGEENVLVQRSGGERGGDAPRSGAEDDDVGGERAL